MREIEKKTHLLLKYSQTQLLKEIDFFVKVFICRSGGIIILIISIST